ncbi:ATP-dependent RNA helicase HrpA [Kitasatospora sp. DSM 101779]|uniref:ATP-dependent RNA helicase HrpA n=1 Tax=Kitasatospora sp. DSM 101779 TaxID=2853165 RepID=UPI0021DB7711|nr:ATP-dependent RNA helicase HrpA [Kitasatospora sp. DSM 101779]MCU7823511.1 ATP-dependent RNA helicase HrpA [Kitasatospora sp. DSM 101779]
MPAVSSPVARSADASTIAELAARLPELMLRDQQRIGRRLDGTRRVRSPEARQKIADELAAEIAQAELRVEQRRGAVPEISYPQELPVSQKKDEILAAIRDHQVVIVAGETGSGKTTQIPKICLELGRGVKGLVGHTQPRRIAARTVAERVAEELATPLGEAVGWKVRFTDQVGQDTLVKLMTDGILLAEIQTDRELRQYDTLIIDEAHERSLNIDFLLGYLKQLLPRRPDLKVVITSATIDPERFAAHFDDAPIVEVSGRTYPVEVRYRPMLEEGAEEDEVDRDRDQVQAICDAVEELQAEGPGDILVFLSGEREIRDTADALNRMKLKSTEVLPLYARLSSAEQHKVFQRSNSRRVVLATNVAETSLTVPGIKYVVDPGTARISRYSHRTKVQRLPIEAVSQASANQRKGRCGRTSDGICIRLYSEEDFLSRPEFTDAEILRTNLASVILQMTAAGLGDIAAFPFLDPPDSRNIKDGVNLLHELGALDPAEKDHRKRLTPLGRKLAQLPVDPRMARMVLEADRLGCVRDVMVIAAALSIQDPRERPAEKRQAADDRHRRFTSETSDFLSYLAMWRYVREQQRELSSSAFRRMCKQEFLNYLRIREWQDVYVQLRTVAKQLGVTIDEPHPDAEPDADRIHQALLSGLLSHIGLFDVEKREYGGARGARFAVFPGSGLFKKPPRWVMSAELVETSRLWARINAKIEPEWVEPLAGHLIKKSYSEPHWEKKAGAVLAYEKVTLYGMPVVAQRKVNYGRIDPELCRELFIRNALVEGDWETHHRFFAENRKLLGEVEELENRARRRDILVDDQTLFDFYDARLPAEIVSTRHFDSWWKKARHEQPDLLNFEKSMLINESADGVTEADYPDHWHQGELRFRLTYQFEPGSDADGVTVHIPLPVLNQVTDEGFDWQIPGLRAELVTAYIRSLPKAIRRNFVPAPDFAAAALRQVKDRQEPLLPTLERILHRMGGVVVPPEAWDDERVPDHLKVTFRVVDGRKKLAESKDLEELRRMLQPKLSATLSSAASGRGIEQAGLTAWPAGLPVLQRTFEQRSRGHSVRAYPALVDEGDSVAVRLFDTPEAQEQAMWAGTRRLLMLRVNSPAKSIQGRLGNQAKLALSYNPHGSIPALFEDVVGAAVDRLMELNGGPAWDEAAFTALFDKVRADLYDLSADATLKTATALIAFHRASTRLKAVSSPVLLNAVNDVRLHLASLVYPGFVTETGWQRLPDLKRYLLAVDRRLEALPDHPQRDAQNLLKVQGVQQAYGELLARVPAGREPSPEIRAIRWMIEELRVSFFAQGLGTPAPVSEKRILKAMDAAAATL